jgi:hypothetical protein
MKPAMTTGNSDSVLPTPSKKGVSNVLDLQSKHHHSAKAQSDTTFRFGCINKVGVVRGFGFSGTNKLKNCKKISVDCNKYSTDKDNSQAKRANTLTGDVCSPLQPHIRTIDFMEAQHGSGATSALLKPEGTSKSKKRKMLRLGSFSDNDEPINCSRDNSLDNFSPLHPQRRVF